MRQKKPVSKRWLLFKLVPLVLNNSIRLSALLFVPRNRRPSSAMAWLLAFFAAPIPATGYFMLVGGKQLSHSRRLRHQQMMRAIEAVTAKYESSEGHAGQRREGLMAAVKLAQKLGAQPMIGGNSATLLTEYDNTILRIAQAIDAAENYVHMEFYLATLDRATKPVFEAMSRAVQRGVKVRVLIDHVTLMRSPGRRRTIKAIEDMGASWKPMLPINPLKGKWQRPDLRNHRKIVVVDGNVGFAGSQNLVDKTYNRRGNIKRGLKWCDLMVRIEGPAVLGLDAVFQGDWFAETGEVLPDAAQQDVTQGKTGNLEIQVLPSGPGFATENNLQVFVALMYSAQHRISITSPYFIPDGGLLHALTSAVARGVDVELFVSEAADQPVVYHAQRSYYEQLLKAGVKIYLYRSPIILHSKHFTIDDAVAVIGSSNMDQRSFNLNEEVSLLVHSAEFVQELDEVIARYRRNSTLLTSENWEKQPAVKQILDNIARLTSSLQ